MTWYDRKQCAVSPISCLGLGILTEIQCMTLLDKHLAKKQ